MKDRNYGFTVFELVIVILILAGLVSMAAIPGRQLIESITVKSRAAVDAANLRTIYMEIEKGLVLDKSMDEISKGIPQVRSEFDPKSKVLVNYSKNTSLSVYFVNDEKYYSLDYLTEIAVSGKTELASEKPFTLGFWYELGKGKINEYIPRK